MRFTADTTHVPRSRRWVVGCAQRAGASAETLRVIALLTTEAVTNAIRHGPADGEVEVSFTRRRDALRVTVRDQSPAAPVIRGAGPGSPDGRGVMLIDHLSTRWGVDHGPGTKAVWFEVPLRA